MSQVGVRTMVTNCMPCMSSYSAPRSSAVMSCHGRGLLRPHLVCRGFGFLAHGSHCYRYCHCRRLCHDQYHHPRRGGVHISAGIEANGRRHKHMHLEWLGPAQNFAAPGSIQGLTDLLSPGVRM